MEENKNISEVKGYVIDEFAHYFESLGAKGLLGRIWGVLLTESGPTSLKEMSRILRVSKPAVSTTIRIGEQIEFFKRVHNPDNPRESFYELRIETMEMIIDPGLHKMQHLVRTLNEAKKKLSKVSPEEKKEEDFELIHNRLSFLIETFEVLFDEYKVFGKKFQTRVKSIRKKYGKL